MTGQTAFLLPRLLYFLVSFCGTIVAVLKYMNLYVIKPKTVPNFQEKYVLRVLCFLA
jgi:hypothetical protein